MKISGMRLLNTLLVGMYVLMIAQGIVQFSLWSQITDIISYNTDPVSLILSGHLHALRFAVVFPALWVSLQTGWDQDLLFTIWVGMAILICAIQVARASSLALAGNESLRRWTFFPSLLVFIGISFAMNGRIAFAFAGIACLLVSQLRWHLGLNRSLTWFLLGQLGSLILMSVSTGTFMVGALVILMFALAQPVIREGRYLRLRQAIHFGSALLVLFSLYPLLGKSVLKNIDFYGGGIVGLIRMLQHGLGRFLPTDPLSLLIFAAGGAFFAYHVLRLLALLVRQQHSLAPVALGASLAMAGGLFGLSTLLVSLPAFAVIGITWAFRPLVVKREAPLPAPNSGLYST